MRSRLGAISTIATLASLLLATAPLGAHASAAGEELARLRAEDQAGRTAGGAAAAGDAARAARVREILASGEPLTGDDYDAAGLVLHHAATEADLALAREAAILAAAGGTYTSLVAAAEDRLLLAWGRPQRFGTQWDQIDRVDVGGGTAVTDALRADVLVPPLEATRSARDRAFEQHARGLAERLEQRADPAWQEQAASRPIARWLAGAVKARARANEARAAEARRHVLRAYRAHALGTASDFAGAATVLARGGDAAELLLANELAAVAALRRHPDGPALFARTWDAFLAAVGKPTRYGTSGGTRASDVIPAFAKAAGLD